MNHRTVSLATAMILFLALPAKGEDVEQPWIEISPPKKRPDPAPKPPPEELEPPPPFLIPIGPRLPMATPGPRRVDLQPGAEFQAPERQPALSERERVNDLIDNYLTALIARERVRQGQVAPAWSDLTQRIEHYWEPRFEQVLDPKISQVSGEWFADMVWRTMRGWYLETQRQRSDPFHQPKRVPGDEVAQAWIGALDLQRAAAMSDDYGHQVVALVEVRFDLQGLGAARLVASSGHPLYDQAALGSVHKAISNTWGDTLPQGPVRTLVAMQGQYTILPPLPVVGFSFDEMLGNFEWMYPLKKMVKGKAVLVALYREKDGPPGQRYSQDGGPPPADTDSQDSANP